MPVTRSRKRKSDEAEASVPDNAEASTSAYFDSPLLPNKRQGKRKKKSDAENPTVEPLPPNKNQARRRPRPTAKDEEKIEEKIPRKSLQKRSKEFSLESKSPSSSSKSNDEEQKISSMMKAEIAQLLDDDDEFNHDTSTFATKVFESPSASMLDNEVEQIANLSSDDDDWEEVVDMEPTFSGFLSKPVEPTTNGSIEIRLSIPEQPKGKKKDDDETFRKRALTRAQKFHQENMHKVHMLCYVAHLLRLSDLLNDPLLQATMLSMVPLGYVDTSAVAFDVQLLFRLLKWFHSAFPLRLSPSDATTSAEQLETTELWHNHLMDCIEMKEVGSVKILAMILTLMLRVLGLEARIVASLHPIPLRATPPTPPKPLKPLKKESKAPSKSKKSGTKSPAKTRVNLRAAKANGQAKKILESGAKKSGKIPVDYWAEVFVDVEDRWICLNPVECTIDKPEQLANCSAKDLSYVIAVDNDLALRDVTVRYCGAVIKAGVRAPIDWWRETLRPYRSRNHHRDRQEKLELRQRLWDLPLPGTLAEYKNHPLYALERDIRKYEGLYPVDTKPVGFFRSEPVYPRTAIRELHGKEFWLKEARVVRVGEEPFKVVQGRAKPGMAKPVEGAPKVEPDRKPLTLYGYWQTEDYMPEVAVDGKVPRNEYGNVYLFKPSMLPIGCVHLPIPGLLHIARKLEIDCVPAIVGWEFAGFGSHPVFEGFVVCKEHKQRLLDAWDREQTMLADKEIDKRSKRARQNWKKLFKSWQKWKKVKGIFNLATVERTAEVGSSTQEASSFDANLAWPRNRVQFDIEPESL